MKPTNIKAVLLLILLTWPFIFRGINTSQLLKLKPKPIIEFNRKSIRSNQLILKMEFASAKFLDKSAINLLKGSTILKVDFLYTSFRTAESFSQPKLNKDRYDVLFKLIPELKGNNLVEWNVFVQTGAKDPDQAKKMLHGFIITYRPQPTEKMTVYELKTMKDVLSAIEITPDPEKTEKINIKKVKHRREFTGKYLPRSRSKRRSGVLYAKKSIWNRRRQYITLYDTINRIKSIVHYKPTKSKSYITLGIPDSTVFSVLNRNKDWKDISFICDVTGSMMPYSTQIMLWHKLNFNTHKAKYFTFFNDGDHKRNGQKKIGSTGGIYNVAANVYNDVEEEITKAMKNGNGGDAPENDIEAILEAIKKYPDANDIVLIADNWSNIKDFKLLEKVNKPIHVIICGYYGGINLDYLNLAFKSGGTIHTIEQDIDNLINLEDGDSIKIGDKKYFIKHGEFKLSSEI